MRVIINNQGIDLGPNTMIGEPGGEGTVFLKTLHGAPHAVKIYHQPTLYRANKVQSLIQKASNLPQRRIAVPLDLVYDVRGTIIGFTMPFMGKDLTEVMFLSNTKQRAINRLSTKDVASIMLDGMRVLQLIHQNNFIVGDLSDQNVLYRGLETMWIDVDSWQFDKYACMVGTENFIVPELYGYDLTKQPLFKPGYDWYSMAVILCKSLLFVHPYGGTHKGINRLTKRAQQGITVFDQSVIYPKIGLPPQILSDELRWVFDRYFIESWRGEFPIHVLENYIGSLIQCNCGEFFPAERRACPICHAASMQPVVPVYATTNGVKVREVIRTSGTFVFTKVMGNHIYAVAIEQGKAVLYETTSSSSFARRKELFNAPAGARYEIFGKTLVVNLSGEDELRLIDVSGDRPVALAKTVTDVYAGNRKAIFRVARDSVYRIAGQSLVATKLYGNMPVDTPLRQVIENQTWFQVDQGNDERIFGLYRVFDQQFYWLINNGMNYDIALQQLLPDEVLMDISVRFSRSSILIRRHTQYKGVDYIRTEIIENDGQIIYSGQPEKMEDQPVRSIHGHAYSGGVALHPTDDGILQERVETRSFKFFDGTDAFVKTDDVLYAYESGILVANQDAISYVTLR